MSVNNLIYELEENSRSRIVLQMVKELYQIHKTIDRLMDAVPCELWPEICRSSVTTKTSLEAYLFDILSSRKLEGYSNDLDIKTIFALRSLAELRTGKSKRSLIEIAMSSDINQDALFLIIFWLDLSWEPLEEESFVNLLVNSYKIIDLTPEFKTYIKNLCFKKMKKAEFYRRAKNEKS